MSLNNLNLIYSPIKVKDFSIQLEYNLHNPFNDTIEIKEWNDMMDKTNSNETMASKVYTILNDIANTVNNNNEIKFSLDKCKNIPNLAMNIINNIWENTFFMNENITNISKQSKDIQNKESIFYIDLKDNNKKTEIKLNSIQNRSNFLYLNVLKNLLYFEWKQSNGNNKTNNIYDILYNEKFHISLYVCGIQAVLKGLSLLSYGFPDLLNQLSLDYLDFFKMIETFIKFSNIPYKIKMYMKSIEEEIIEYYVWKKDSSLFNIIMNEAKLQNLHKIPNIHLNTLQLLYKKILTLAIYRISMLSEILLFDQNIMNLIWTAVKYCLIKKSITLLVNHHLDQIILCCMYASCKLYQRINNENYYNNKIFNEIDFKKIIKGYKKLISRNSILHNLNRVIYQVEMVDKSIDIIGDNKIEKRYGDIIEFYNLIFIPIMSSFFVRCQNFKSIYIDNNKDNSMDKDKDKYINISQSREDTIHTLASEAIYNAIRCISTELNNKISNPKTLDHKNDMNRLGEMIEEFPFHVRYLRPIQIKKTNIYVSPMKSMHVRKRNKSSKTISRSSAIYSIGRSPPEDLEMINKTINSVKPPFLQKSLT